MASNDTCICRGPQCKWERCHDTWHGWWDWPAAIASVEKQVSWSSSTVQWRSLRGTLLTQAKSSTNTVNSKASHLPAPVPRWFLFRLRKKSYLAVRSGPGTAGTRPPRSLAARSQCALSPDRRGFLEAPGERRARWYFYHWSDHSCSISAEALE